MKDWIRIAEGYDLHIPEPAFERITPALDSLEKSFRPLAASLPATLEPATIFEPAEDDE